jgi:hypothetical protein
MPRMLCMVRILSCVLAWVAVAPVRAASEPPTFSPQQLQEDLAALEAAIARIHPDVRHSVDEVQLKQALADVRAQLSRKLTRDEAWVALSALNPILADGHLVASFPGGAKSEVKRHLQAGGLLFPFGVHIDAQGEVFVTSKASGEPTALQGARLEAIDGMPGREVSARLLAHMNGDTPGLRAQLASQRFSFMYWKLAGDRRSYRLRVGGVESVVAGTSDVPLAYRDPAFEGLFRFELLGNQQAVLSIGEFYWQDKAKFYELTKAAFTRMREAGTRTLIIDIRANSGGDDDMWLEGLMPYVATKPYRNGSDYVVKIIEGRQKEGQKVGDVVAGTQSWNEPVLDNPLRFTGKTYVLIGPATYSSAVLFANVVHDFGFATLAGTGGYARSTQSGGTQNVKLPHTQINLVVPRFVLKRPSGAGGLLQPDILVIDDPLRPQAALEALLQLTSATPSG